MNDCILQMHCLQNKTIAIYRGDVRMLIPLPSLICMILSRITNGEMQIYKRFISASNKERKQIKEKLLTNFIDQKPFENETEYGHPYVKSWNKINMGSKNNNEVRLVNEAYSSFWQEMNEKHKTKKRSNHPTFEFVHNGHNRQKCKLKTNQKSTNKDLITDKSK